MRYKVATEQVKVKKRRPGVHSKNNNSKVKKSKSYKKKYIGQGR